MGQASSQVSQSGVQDVRPKLPAAGDPYARSSPGGEQMLRKTKLRLVVMMLGAIAAFSVVGVAASFQINNGNGGRNIVNAEGSTLVVSCSDDVRVKKVDRWVDGTNGSGSGGFIVRFIGINANSQDCGGKYFIVVLTDVDGKRIAQKGFVGDDWVRGEANFESLGIKVKDLHDVHVLIQESAPSGDFDTP
ncbi:MAG TPA: hypothetical protein PJ994_02970 [Tepidiformaceae bacterium]|nr:hypothetical protein [Tepidiformaceae bacterium]